MNKAIRAVLCLLLAVTFCGCASQDTQSSVSDINIVDAGGVSVISTINSSPEISGELFDTNHSSPEMTTTASAFVEVQPDVTTEGFTATQAPLPEPEETNEPSSTTVATTTYSTTAEQTSISVTTQTTTSSTTIIETTQETTTENKPIEHPDIEVGENSYTALNYDEVKAVWISYLELGEILQGKSRETFRANIGEVFDNCAELGINTVYVHARSHSDAYYESELFPWSKYASGKINTALDYDPLEIMINEAHKRELSFHAWINPLRACSTSDMASYGSYPVGMWNSDAATSGKYVVAVGSYYYLNPAYDAVVQLIADGAAEIVAGYDVDGLHIDDYFYPTTDKSFDSSAFNASEYSVLSDFRFNNCDKLVSALYDSVKSANPSALFSVSCQGSVENNYNLMYADVKKWCAEEGYLDYIAPQIYYGFDNSTQPYITCLNEWDAIAQQRGIPLVVGLSVSKIGYEDVWAGEGKQEWLTDEQILARQTSEAKQTRSYGGIALYSYRSIFAPASEVSEQVSDEINALKTVL